MHTDAKVLGLLMKAISLVIYVFYGAYSESCLTPETRRFVSKARNKINTNVIELTPERKRVVRMWKRMICNDTYKGKSQSVSMHLYSGEIIIIQ